MLIITPLICLSIACVLIAFAYYLLIPAYLLSIVLSVTSLLIYQPESRMAAILPDRSVQSELVGGEYR